MRYDLYIDGKLCDLDDSSLIVLTYTMEKLTNPTAIINTYSHEVELPSTERNDIIFSHFYRNDYRVGNGNFSPISRVPFAIYNELSEIAESGYIKLNEVQVDKIAHTYKVVLYGGLGFFFYMLGYSDNGDALKLSDLQYMTNAEDENKLNFPITAEHIRNSWNALAIGGAERYTVINFAPMYNGVPSGDFEADKAIYLGRRNGTTSSISYPIYGVPTLDITKMKETNLTAVTKVYATMVTLGKDFTEWETKDMRAYLQRPVLSIRKFVEAVQRRATAYGYTLNLDSAFFNENNPYYNDAWVTLPTLQSLTKDIKEGQTQLSANIVISSTEVPQEQDISYTLPSVDGYEYGKEFKNVKIQIPEIAIQVATENINSITNAVTLSGIYDGKWAYIAWILQAYIVDSSDNIMGASDVVVMSNTPNISATEIATSAGYTPITVGAQQTEYKHASAVFYKLANGICQNNANIELTIPTASNAERIILRIEKRSYNNTPNTTPTNIVFSDTTNPDRPDYFEFEGVANSVFGVAEVSANATVRSGSIINKSDLLNIGKSPLDMLLSYCKLFGLIWHYENSSQTITLQQRSTFYGEGNAVDFDNRIDRNKDIKIKPFEFDKRFYDFELETQGEWAEQYEAKYGRPYGTQRVNTGYNFDKEAKNLLDGNSLKGGAEVLEQSKYFCRVVENGQLCPSVFLEGGEYTEYGEEDSEGVAVQTPTSNATIRYFNELQGYDYISKLQAHKENKPIDSGGTLLLLKGNINTNTTIYSTFRVSDDIPEMAILNEGKMCWILEGSFPQTNAAMPNLNLPHFVRANGVSLDMGVPQELDNPDVDTEAVQNSIYSQYWRDYLGDRYDTNSRVCECYVDLRGLQVGNALFRNFYYFDNAVWVLNKIANYSMTTEETTLCEFVKVQDVKNYKGV